MEQQNKIFFFHSPAIEHFLVDEKMEREIKDAYNEEFLNKLEAAKTSRFFVECESLKNGHLYLNVPRVCVRAEVTDNGADFTVARCSPEDRYVRASARSLCEKRQKEGKFYSIYKEKNTEFTTEWFITEAEKIVLETVRSGHKIISLKK